MPLIRIDNTAVNDGDVSSLNLLKGDLTIVGVSGVHVSDDGSSVITLSFPPPTGQLIPDQDAVYNIGTSGYRYATVHGVSGMYSVLTTLDSTDLTLLASPGKNLEFQIDELAGGTLGGRFMFSERDGTNFYQLYKDSNDWVWQYNNTGSDAMTIFGGADQYYFKHYNAPGINDIVITDKNTSEMTIYSSIDGSGWLGTESKRWNELKTVHGTIEQLTTSGVVLKGHVIPDITSSYSVGASGYRLMILHAASGSFDSINIADIGSVQFGGIDFIKNWETNNAIAIGKSAGANISNCTYVGKNAGNANTGTSCSAMGNAALSNNTGTYCSAMGYSALYNNTGTYCSAMGTSALSNNTGTFCSAMGVNALSNNTGTYCSAMGTSALSNNTGTYCSAMGNAALQNNTGTSCSAMGVNALYNNNGSYNTAYGRDAFNTWTNNTGAAKTCTSGNFTVATQQVVVTGHSFGSNGTYINLQISTNGTLPAGLDAGVDQWKIIDINTLQVITDSFTNGGSGVHTLTPPVTYTNSTALGYNAEPTASNQVFLGDTSVTEVKTEGRYNMSAAAVEARIEAHTVTEPRFVPSVTGSGHVGTSALKWREVNAVSGIFTNLGGNSPITLHDDLHVINQTTDIGHAGAVLRHLYATSGTLDEAVINGISHSTIPPILYAVQASGGPVDQRRVHDHIIPDIDEAHDIGTDGFAIRRITATSGVFDNIAGASPIAIHDHLVPSSNNGVDLGHSGANFGIIHATSGKISHLTADSCLDIDLPAAQVDAVEASGIGSQTLDTEWVDVQQFCCEHAWGNAAAASGGGGTGHLQILENGVYHMSLGLDFESTKSTQYECAVFKNGAPDFILHKHGSVDTEWQQVNHSHLLIANSGDYFNLKMRVDSGTDKLFDLHHGDFGVFKIRGQ